MRCLPLLLGLGLAFFTVQAAPTDHTVAGLRQLRATCFPTARTARPVTCDWISPTPIIVRYWPQLQQRAQLQQQDRTAAWLVNETAEGGTLIVDSTLPIEVAFTSDNKRGLPHVRCWEANLTESVEALTRESQSGGAPPSSLGNKLLFAALADLGGGTEGAKKLAQAVFAQSPDPAVPVAWALDLAANGQYGSALTAFQRTGDLATFRRECEVIVKRFPECWPARQAVENIVAGLVKKPSAPPAKLSEEDQSLIEEIATYVPDADALNNFQDTVSWCWVIGPLPAIKLSHPVVGPPPTPLVRLVARGPAAIPLLAAICDSDRPTRYTGGSFGFRGLGSLAHFDPLVSSGDSRNLTEMLPRPLTVGEIASLLLWGVLQVSPDNRNPAAIRAAASDWMAAYGSMEGPDLLRALLKNLPPEQHSHALQPALASSDQKWEPILEKYVDTQPPSMMTLNIVSQMTSRPGERFHAAARKFLAKVQSKDDLLPEYLKNSNMRETNPSHHREQIEQQLEKIRQTVGDANPATPSA